MTTSEAHELPFSGVRARFDSDKTFDELRDDLLADIGTEPAQITDLRALADRDWNAFAADVQRQAGPSDFMLMHLIDHGSWLPAAGVERKVLRVILGNPLIAITMIRHDLTAGLFAPVEVLLTEEADNRSALTYVKPSSLMVVEENPPLLAAALVLDDKLAALAKKIASTGDAP
ncbi:DUF302 domain-containing protein [Mycolicibacterium llatzerense]|uniref:DUF302 domain-containing protein n=1 Tax=Mycolicibacterium llatzerense TaxID=280871 RepID=UPI0008DC74B6|nr:DUF302 domain-containing protein [Mycolicibacterium llatzerense]MCT7362426.1 hypothetical protein [Mycolicibacterium llatzerense]